MQNIETHPIGPILPSPFYYSQPGSRSIHFLIIILVDYKLEKSKRLDWKFKRKLSNLFKRIFDFDNL